MDFHLLLIHKAATLAVHTLAVQIHQILNRRDIDYSVWVSDSPSSGIRITPSPTPKAIQIILEGID
jgi:hypothetical protein